MSRVVRYKSTSGNDKEYIISRSISQPKKYWNIEVLKQGKRECFESGYSTIKMARERLSEYQVAV